MSYNMRSIFEDAKLTLAHFLPSGDEIRVGFTPSAFKKEKELTTFEIHYLEKSDEWVINTIRSESSFSGDDEYGFTSFKSIVHLKEAILLYFIAEIKEKNLAQAEIIASLEMKVDAIVNAFKHLGTEL